MIWREYDSASVAVRDALDNFRLPRLQGQPTYVELWVEKDALAGVLRPIAAQYHIALMVNRGYSSASAMKESGDRIRERCTRYGSTRAAVLYLGDLDPSGEDMVRDVRERLGTFINSGSLTKKKPGSFDFTVEKLEDAERRKPWIDLEVEKLALTIEQVEEHEPPPNPTKLTDSRAPGFIAQYGHESWEVDALPPSVLRELIREGLEARLDLDLMAEVEERETTQQNAVFAAVKEAMRNFDGV